MLNDTRIEWGFLIFYPTLSRGEWASLISSPIFLPGAAGSALPGSGARRRAGLGARRKKVFDISIGIVSTEDA